MSFIKSISAQVYLARRNHTSSEVGHAVSVDFNVDSESRPSPANLTSEYTRGHQKYQQNTEIVFLVSLKNSTR